MDFAEAIKALAEKTQKIKSGLNTEEATKTALVMPFIWALGYDVFNPHEVVPEFIADIAGKKGEKVDYAIMQNDKPIMIIECKAYGVNLNDINRDQLHRYFLTLDSCIGILTDGVRYRFFSASDDGKNMDATPFMEFDLDNIDPTLLPELRKLCKGKFDLKTTLDTVSELKFNRQIKLILSRNLKTPEEEFIRYFMGETGVKAMPKAREQFSGYVKRAFEEFINEQVDGRLKTALAATSKKEEEPQSSVAPVVAESEITENEWQAFYLIKSILMGTVDADRIHLRNLTGTGRSIVIMDDSIHKPLVRISFHVPGKLSVDIIGQNKEKQTIQITKVEDLLSHTETIRATASMYLAGKPEKVCETSAPTSDAAANAA